MKQYVLLLLINATTITADTAYFKPKAHPNDLPSYGQRQVVPQAQESPEEQADELYETMETPDPSKHDLEDVGFGEDPDITDWD